MILPVRWDIKGKIAYTKEQFHSVGLMYEAGEEG